MKKIWTSTKGFIFDVDGTLYPQGPVRANMLFRLIRAVGARQISFRDVYAIYCFRKMREQPPFSNLRIEDLCHEVSLKVRLSEKHISEIIKKWMFEVPLDLINKFCFSDVRQFIEEQHQAGKAVFIYSDYPAEDKLRTMGIPYDRVFVSQTESLVEQKPSLSAMNYILSETAISPDSLVYVGDRNDKDKISAEMVNIKYYDIKRFRSLLRD